jgi:hypothetical protein
MTDLLQRLIEKLTGADKRIERDVTSEAEKAKHEERYQLLQKRLKELHHDG